MDKGKRKTLEWRHKTPLLLYSLLLTFRTFQKRVQHTVKNLWRIFYAKIVIGSKPWIIFSEKTPSYMFDRGLNMHLHSVQPYIVMNKFKVSSKLSTWNKSSAFISKFEQVIALWEET